MSFSFPLMKAKKHFGQHFLINLNKAEVLVDTMLQYSECNNYLEIGPGKGVLTELLIKKEVNFKAFDVDKDMIFLLKEKYPDHEDSFVLSDILKVDFDQVYNGSRFTLLGNYPYNISTEIVFKMIHNRSLVTDMIGMFQKEVADRIIASHGSKIYGVTSVLTQAFYTGFKVFDLEPHEFDPPPKVHSSVVRFKRREQDFDVDTKWLFRVVKMAFNQRRKMLRNSLKSLVPDKDLLQQKVFTLRPEQLSVQNFVDLTNLIHSNYES